MQIYDKRLDEIKPYENNPRHNDNAVDAVANSIREFGFKVPIVVDSDGVIVAGHTRYKAAQKLGLQTVPCLVADDLNEEQINAFRLADNKVGELATWDDELLNIELDDITDIDMSLFGFELEEPDLDIGEEKSSLDDTFSVVPTTVIDARKGEWIDRKRAWYALGLRSNDSREEMKTTGSLSGCTPGYYEKKAKCEQTLGRKLSNKEFEENYLQNYIPKNTMIANTNSGGILSIFDPVLCETLYKWFAIEGGSVLDPFSGGSVRGVVASKLGLKYTGVDLRQKQVDANIEQGKQLCEGNMPIWLCGDSSEIDKVARGGGTILYFHALLMLTLKNIAMTLEIYRI